MEFLKDSFNFIMVIGFFIIPISIFVSIFQLIYGIILYKNKVEETKLKGKNKMKVAFKWIIFSIIVFIIGYNLCTFINNDKF